MLVRDGKSELYLDYVINKIVITYHILVKERRGNDEYLFNKNVYKGKCPLMNYWFKLKNNFIIF